MVHLVEIGTWVAGFGLHIVKSLTAVNAGILTIHIRLLSGAGLPILILSYFIGTCNLTQAVIPQGPSWFGRQIVLENLYRSGCSLNSPLVQGTLQILQCDLELSGRLLVGVGAIIQGSKRRHVCD